MVSLSKLIGIWTLYQTADIDQAAAD